MRRFLLRPLPLLLLSLSLLTIYFFSNSNPNTNPSPSLHLGASNWKAPKIYLYDLPRKFTYGVIESYAAARGAATTDPLKYPGHQHSGEWFLFDDLNRADRAGSPLQRTLDPDEADLFYVPFFSSLSLVVNPIRPADGAKGPVYSDEGMQEELINWLEGSKYWKRNNERDIVFIAQDPNAQYKVIDKVRNGIMLVSDFGRLKGDQASLIKDVILPYSHRINSYNGEIRVENRKSLLFFMGNRYRKEVKLYFEYDDPSGAVNEIWHQVSSKVPFVKLMINREKRLVGRGSRDPDCSCICTGRNGTNTGL